jgi:NAD(P)-dependent dehydrogenase (short-subunit alcohol dehydrogenase family)
MKNIERFARVAVITGGGSGLGRALALNAAQRGMRLMLADVDAAGLQETARLIGERQADAQVETRIVDVSQLDQVDALAQATLARYGAAHLLFNNAGVGVSGPIWENSAQDWQWVMGVNVYGVAWGIKSFVPIMLKQGVGHIVNVASAAGWMNAPGTGIYNVSKCAVVAMSETLALDLAQASSAIGVSVLSPAFFPTGIADSARNRPASAQSSAPISEAQRLCEERVRYAVQHGKLSADEVAEITLQAVDHQRFYIFPHAKIKALVKARADAADRAEGVFDPYAG